MESSTNFPLVVIGLGGVVAFYNPANLRFFGYLTMAAGIGMLLVKRS